MIYDLRLVFRELYVNRTSSIVPRQSHIVNRTSSIVHRK